MINSRKNYQQKTSRGHIRRETNPLDFKDAFEDEERSHVHSPTHSLFEKDFFEQSKEGLLREGRKHIRRESSQRKKKSDSIQVLCRFRPFKSDKGQGEGRIETEFYPDKSDVKAVKYQFSAAGPAQVLFAFDQVFWGANTQIQVYEAVCPMVQSVTEGFNATILAYGQTSSGKTFTMEGPTLWDQEEMGVIPRAIDTLFAEIKAAESVSEFTIKVSYVEIYCEKVRDLLQPESDNLPVRELKDGVVSIGGVTEVSVTDKQEVLEVVERGKLLRATASTLMNEESSRSHSLLTIMLSQVDIQTGRVRKGKLVLVDLAGSEKVSKTGAHGMRLEEAKNINRSLTTLGMVITALSQDSTHIPYRDSKLTRILQDSLGGNSHTALIVCCAPEACHSSETISTLRFGERAKKVQNKVQINEELGVGELQAMLEKAQQQILELEASLKEARSQTLLRSESPPKIFSQQQSSEELSKPENEETAPFCGQFRYAPGKAGRLLAGRLPQKRRVKHPQVKGPKERAPASCEESEQSNENARKHKVMQIEAPVPTASQLIEKEHTHQDIASLALLFDSLKTTENRAYGQDPVYMQSPGSETAEENAKDCNSKHVQIDPGLQMLVEEVSVQLKDMQEKNKLIESLCEKNTSLTCDKEAQARELWHLKQVIHDMKNSGRRHFEEEEKFCNLEEVAQNFWMTSKVGKKATQNVSAAAGIDIWNGLDVHKIIPPLFFSQATTFGIESAGSNPRKKLCTEIHSPASQKEYLKEADLPGLKTTGSTKEESPMTACLTQTNLGRKIRADTCFAGDEYMFSTTNVLTSNPSESGGKIRADTSFTGELVSLETTNPLITEINKSESPSKGQQKQNSLNGNKSSLFSFMLRRPSFFSS